MDEDALAKRRLWAMTAVRLVGFAVILSGFWLVGSVQGKGAQLWGGLAVILLGLLVFLLGPKALSRRWKA